MGLTYAKAFLRSQITTTDDLMILEKSAEKAEILAEKNIGKIYDSAQMCLQYADLVILAVKPQDTELLFSDLRDLSNDQQVFLSIMAGVKMEHISRSLDVSKIIRAMPNLPAQKGTGMTVFTSSDAVTRLELVMVQNLINTTGKSIYVEDEHAIDAATAISGSGPAYVFYFMNALIKAAKMMGFNSSEAELLVSQTFRGAVDLYKNADLTCEQWIQKVASKGGTTEAALNSYLTNKVHEDIILGANAALIRAIELGNASENNRVSEYSNKQKEGKAKGEAEGKAKGEADNLESLK